MSLAQWTIAATLAAGLALEATAQESVDPTLIGRWPAADSNINASFGDVALYENIAVVTDLQSRDRSVKLIDVSTPEEPALLSTLSIDTVSYFVTAANGYAYVSTSGRIIVVNLMNPLEPFIAGDLQIEARDTVAEDDRLYVAQGTAGSVAVVDISNPAAPEVLGRYSTGGSPLFIQARDGLIYSATGSTGLVALDARDPKNIQPIEVPEPRPEGSNLALSESHLILTRDGVLSRFEVVELSSLRTVGSLPGVGGTTHSLAVEGDTVVAANTDQIQLADLYSITDPANPALIGKYVEPAPPKSVIGQDWADGVALREGLLYVASLENGLHIVDITAPTLPKVTKRIAKYAHAMTAAPSGRVFLSTRDGIEILERSREGYSLSPDIIPDHSPQNFIAVSDTLLFAGGYKEVFSLDVESKAVLGRWETNWNISDLAVIGNYLFVAKRSRGLDILDITDPANPVLTQSVEAMEGQWLDKIPHAREDLLITMSSQRILSFWKPNEGTIELIATVENPQTLPPTENPDPEEIVLLDFGADGWFALDVGNPEDPRLYARIDEVYAMSSMLHRNFAYLIGFAREMSVFDLSDPSNPVRVGGNSVYQINHDGVHVIADDMIILYADPEILIFETLPTPRSFRPFSPHSFEGLMLEYFGARDETATIQRSYDLRSWHDWTTAEYDPRGVTLRDEETPAQGSVFYRAVVDSDGLSSSP